MVNIGFSPKRIATIAAERLTMTDHGDADEGANMFENVVGKTLGIVPWMAGGFLVGGPVGMVAAVGLSGAAEDYNVTQQEEIDAGARDGKNAFRQVSLVR